MHRGAHANLTGNASVLRRVNTVRLLQRLWRGGAASRVSLARDTGLDAKTVGSLCRDLLDGGWLRETAQPASGRGRPAHMLSLNGGAAGSIGVDIGARQVTVLRLDFAGAVQDLRRRRFAAAPARATLWQTLEELVQAVLAATPLDRRDRLNGLGVCVPGFLDASAGRVVETANLPALRDFPIVERLAEHFGLPVQLEEGSRAMALAEVWFGVGREHPDFVCLDLGYGIGMGIVHGGRLFYGAHGFSGEIGHTVVQPDGERCGCGKLGCLETIASGRALAAAAARLGIADGAAGLAAAAVHGHAEARDCLVDAGRSIGVAAANVMTLFDPATVVLNGGLVQAGDLLVGPLVAAATRHSMPRYREHCPILVSVLGARASALGAAMLSLRHHFEFANIDLDHAGAAG